jgi:ABC-2 type transport system ATP-binding protein
MIDINLLSKKYGEQTVLDIELLNIPSGQTFGLVGNNGAGKTTLFSLILDLIEPTTGEVKKQ